MCAAQRGSPDHDHAVKDRLAVERPGLSVDCKLVRRIRWNLAELGDDALAPVDMLPDYALRLPAAA